MDVFAPPARALLRAVSGAYARCLRRAAAAVDPARARAQQAGYAAALAAAGVEVSVLPADERFPDSCFIEDTAIVTDGAVLLTRPGAVSRRGEVAAVEAALAAGGSERVEVGTLDGGDVLRAGDVLFVGASSRTDAGGRDALASFARRRGLDVVAVTVRSGLHLKSAVTMIDPHTAVVRAEALDVAPLRDHGLELVGAIEPAGANVLALGSVVLVSAAAPRTADLLAARGHAVRAVDIDELHKGDGALTCLSLRFPPSGGWCV